MDRQRPAPQPSTNAPHSSFSGPACGPPLLRNLALVLSAAVSLAFAAQDAKAPAGLLPNGDFEADTDDDGWPDGWPREQATRRQVEQGNHFLRIQPDKPGQMICVYRSLPVQPDWKALELTFRVRHEGVKRGKELWHDARIILDFKDAAGGKLKPGPRHPNFTGTSDGWQTRTERFLVPEGAKTFELMPSMFGAAAGTLDVDDFRLSAIAPRDVDQAPSAPAKPPARKPEPAPAVPVRGTRPPPAELHVAGNRLVTPDGKEAWLQGLSVPSLEWSARGESVPRSIATAVETWKANVIRLPVSEARWFGRGDDQKQRPDAAEAYRRNVDQAIEAAETRGAWLVLDLHGFRAPTEQTVAFWQDAAARYKDRPAVLMGLFNEPHDMSWTLWRDGGELPEKPKAPAPAENAANAENAEHAKKLPVQKTPGMQRLIDAVRAAGAKNVVVVGGLDWGYDLSGVVGGFALSDAGGNGIVYDSHIYPWKRDWAGKVLTAAAKHPILVGETGCEPERMPFIPPEAHEDPYTWAPDMIALIQKHRLNWTAWSFHPSARPRVIQDWSYTPTPFWGAFVRAALLGARFELRRER